jgi:pyruvate,orthophosphate dikinase
MAELYAILPAAKPAPGGAAEVGNKAWNLMIMAQAGLPVPPAFVLPVDWCNRPVPGRDAAMRQALAAGIRGLEAATGKTFGGANRPLLVSVRSGGAVSMPGMMETVLDIGLNRETVEGLIRQTGNPRLAWDNFRRLIQGYAEVVPALPTAPFDALIAAALLRADAQMERELDHRDFKRLTMDMLACYAKLTGAPFPADPHEQLAAATASVFRSWDAPKAASYRHMNGISDAAGTAVTVQTMVYGNAGALSGAGVGFTRNPATGAKSFYFDFKFNAQGEDIVAGRQKLSDDARVPQVLPGIWAKLQETCGTLEKLCGDAQDFEFTIEEGVLFLLQTRRAKRTDWAALAIAVDMVAEHLITPEAALKQLSGIALGKVVRTSFGSPMPTPLAAAEIASMGVAGGALALDTAAVKRLAAAGQPAILVRAETVTADIEGMALAAGILTGSGGRTSHAAVVARQLGKVCLVACPGLEIDLRRHECRIGAQLLKEGDPLSLDGNTGEVYSGILKPIIERPESALATIAAWAEAVPKPSLPA